ncbi:MAG: hypothetical protein QOH71_2471 [Blastocatellia bacterium]|jgi:hypothetical protein|nr:hypothetical protein [Blastocatellia bacterium]
MEMMGFGSQEEWERFNIRFPKFVEKYAALEAVRDMVFQRSGVGDKLQRIIFGLGRVCSEDFQQALILCGNGFGIGALQIIRGLYERQTTAAYLIRHPEDLDDFLDYHFVQMRRGMNHAKKMYTGDEFTKLVPKERQEEIEQDYQNVIRRFTEKVCEKCNTTKPMASWSKYSTPELAKRAERGLAELYYVHYFQPTMFSHSSVYSILARLREDEKGEPIFDNEGQRRHIPDALVAAHLLLIHVLDMHNDYFKLGLENDIRRIYEDYKECWLGYEPPNELAG